jgi:hypothetical protein
MKSYKEGANTFSKVRDNVLDFEKHDNFFKGQEGDLSLSLDDSL